MTSARSWMQPDRNGPSSSGSRRASLCCAIFAASYPDRAVALLAFAGVAASRSTPDFPWGAWENAEGYLDRRRATMGNHRLRSRRGLEHLARHRRRPRLVGGLRRRDATGGQPRRRGETPPHRQPDRRARSAAVRSGCRRCSCIGPTIRTCRWNSARYIAEQIPGATLVELPGKNHGYMAPDQDAVLEEVARFLRRLHAEEAEFDRVLATVLFTDIVGSTERRSRARRSGLARGPRRASRGHTRDARSLSRNRDPHCGRRLLRVVRWAGQGDPMRARDRRARSPRSVFRSARGSTPERSRRLDGERRRGSPSRSARASAPSPGPDEVLVALHRQGPHDRLGTGLRGCGRA